MTQNFNFTLKLSPITVKFIAMRLVCSHDSLRAIAKAAMVSPRSVNRIKSKLTKINLNSATEIASLTNEQLYQKLYPKSEVVVPRSDSDSKLIPDFAVLTSEMLEKRISIKECYEDYLQQAALEHKEPLSLSYFSNRIKMEKDTIEKEDPDFYYAQNFPFGMYAQLDFTGDQYELQTYNGRISCYIMVICFPASYYMQAQFVTGQTTEESCRVLSEVFKRLSNRCPSIIVTDNARCWVTKHQYGKESVPNANFANYLQEMGICPEASPAYRPRTKSCAEHSVNRVQTLLSSCKQDFASNLRSIAEHNKVLMDQVDLNINQGPFRRSTKVTRDYLFRTYEYPLLNIVQNIPAYQGDAISKVVPNSYLVEVHEHEYSVPFMYIGKRIDIYVGNDYIIMKYEGKEIARHLRADGEGRTIKDCHMPKMHQEIAKKKKLYSTVDDVRRISKSVDEGVYRFCCFKINSDQDKGVSTDNTIKCCRAVINGFKRSQFKDIYSEACISLLNQPQNLWNSYGVENMFNQVLEEYLDNRKIQHQTEIFRPNDEGDAHIRNEPTNGDEDL